MQSQIGRYNQWFHLYQYHLKQFVLFRWFKSKRSTEIAYQLLDIFIILKVTRSILQIQSTREFVNYVMENSELGIYRKGKWRHWWLVKDKVTIEFYDALSRGFRFVEDMKNRARDKGFTSSSHEALFGQIRPLGLKTSKFPDEFISNAQSEEEL